jgi:FkbM family methyltransferase
MWREITLRTRASFGARFHCRLNDSVQGVLFVFGVWEPNLASYLQRRIKKGDIFIDVGANIGYFSLLASTLVGAEGKVYSIEASPSIFKLLSEHIAINAAENVTALNIAAAAEQGVLNLYQGPAENLGSTSILQSQGMILEATVPADKLSTIVGQDLLRAKVIKIDVEGAELPVLLDILSVAGNLPRDQEIAVELNPAGMEQFGISPKALLDQFEQAGYHAYIIENGYTNEAYLQGLAIKAPYRLRFVPDAPIDLVFSRIDAEEL